MSAWQVWLIAGLVLVTAEIFTPGFVVACFGLGAFVAAVPAFAGASLNVQLAVFAVATLLVFWFARPYLKKGLRSDAPVRTNAAAVLGKVGRVSQAITRDGPGRVVIDGDDWRAEAVGDRPIAAGERVRVVRMESVTVVVEPVAAPAPVAAHKES